MTYYRRKHRTTSAGYESNYVAVRRVTSCSDGFGQYDFSLLFYREYLGDSEKPLWGSCRPDSMRTWGDEITEEEARRLIPNLDDQDAQCELPSPPY